MQLKPLTDQQKETFDSVEDREQFIEWFRDSPAIAKSSWDIDRYQIAVFQYGPQEEQS